MTSLRAALESFCAHTAESMLDELTEADVEELRRHLAVLPSLRPEVRRTALHLAGRIRDDAAVEPIRGALGVLDVVDRISAVDALGRIGTPAALAAVVKASQDAAADVRRVAVQALARIGGSETVDHLRRLAAEDPAETVRSQAAEVLGDAPREAS
jgi:HEAT repeat protein